MTQVVDENSTVGKQLTEIYEGLGIALYDTDGQLRSSYDIFSDLSQIWGTLDKNTQNYIASVQAGTNQFQNFAALMQNFGHASEATAVALNSAGSAARENEAFMGSLESRLSALSATFESFSNNVLSSDLVGGILDIANALLKLVNTPVGTAVTQFLLLTGVLTGLTGVFGPIVGKIGGVFQALAKGGGIVKTLSSAFTGLKTALTAGAGGFAAVSAAAVPVAGIISAVVVGVEIAIRAFDALTVSLEEQQEKVDSLKNDLGGLKSEYDQLASKENLTENEQRKLDLLEAQIKANDQILKQEAQKLYNEKYGKDSKLGFSKIFTKEFWTEGRDPFIAGGQEHSLTGVQRVQAHVDRLKEMQGELRKVEDQILALDSASAGYQQNLERLTKIQQGWTDQITELNAQVSTEVQEMSTLGENLGGLPSDAQQVIDSYIELINETNGVEEATKTLTQQLKEISNVEIMPTDAESMEEWLKSMSSNDFIKLQTILKGLGNDAGNLSELLSNMSGADAVRIINQAYKEFYGTVETGTEALNEFEKALKTDYGEGLGKMAQALDYVIQSQDPEKGIKNYQAYKQAMLAVYGTMEVTAEAQERYNKSFQSYFADGEFQTQTFINKLKETGKEWSDYVTVVENADGSVSLDVSDFSELAESLDLTEPMLSHFFDALKAYGDINVTGSVTALESKIIDLQKTLDKTAPDIYQQVSKILMQGEGSYGTYGYAIELYPDFKMDEVPEEEFLKIQEQANKALENTGIKFNFDVNEDDLDNALVTINNVVANLSQYVDEAGNLDFSDFISQVEKLGNEKITIDGSNITIEDDQAAQQFIEQLVGDLSEDSETAAKQIDLAGAIIANMESAGYEIDMSKIIDADKEGKTIASQLNTAINEGITLENAAWSDSVVEGGDNIGASLEVASGQATNLKTTTDEAKQSVTELNGAKLTDVTEQFGNLNTKAGEAKTSLGNILTTLNNLTSGTWEVKTDFPSGVGSGLLMPGSSSASGMETKGNQYKPLRYTNTQDDLVGEEGEELLITASGEQKIVGKNGAEFISVKPGDTIIPADVTAMIKNGRIGAYGDGLDGEVKRHTGKTSLSGGIVSNAGNISIGDITSAYSGGSISWVGGSKEVDKNTSSVKKNTSAKNESAQATKKATDANEELNDALEEQKKLFDEQNDILEHQIFIREKQGASTEELVKLNRQYQKQLHDQANWYRKQGLSDTSGQIRELQKSWWSLEDDITDLQRDAFEERLKLSEDYIDDRNDFNDWGADSEVEAWKRVLEWQEEWYKKGLVDYETYCEKHKEATKNLIKAEKEAWKKAKEEEIDRLETQQDAYEALFDIISDKAQEEIDKLQEERDTVEKYWNDKIEALQKVNEELDEQLEREEALDALARARQTKVMVYKDGRFQYINDTDAVSEAKENLNRIEREQKLKEEIERLEANRDKELEVLDKKIKDWEKFEEEWQKLLDHYQNQQKENLIKEQLNIDKQEILNKMEAKNWQDRINNLTQYVSQYEALMDRLAQAQQELEEMEEEQSSGGGGSHTSSGMGTGSAIGGVIGGPIGSIIGGAIGGTIGNAIDKVTGGNKGSSSSSGKHYTVDSSGNAPSSAKPGDVVHTGGGSYQVVSPGTPGSKYNPSSGKWSVKLAKGTKNASNGMALVGENGPELRILNRGDGVIPTNLTNNLWKWGQFTPHDLINHTFATDNNGGGTSITIQNFNPNLSGVKDGEGFVEYMKHNFARSVVQFVGRRG